LKLAMSKITLTIYIGYFCDMFSVFLHKVKKRPEGL
jgi:hypothetical protein